jgi:hypothetical protein
LCFACKVVQIKNNAAIIPIYFISWKLLTQALDFDLTIGS